MAFELNKVDENRKIFLSNISHDIKTPLTNINGFLEAMKDGTIKKEDYEKYIDILSNETKRLINFTKEIITINTLYENEVIICYDKFEINTLIKDVLKIFEGRIRNKNITFNLVFAEKETYVYADRDKIYRVIYNIIDNAIKFCNDGKGICIETTIEDKKVRISIIDEGIGLAEKNLKDVWKRFYKLDESRGTEKNSFGLGLYIVKQIIDAHEENISVQSKEGEWTKFDFTVRKFL